MTRQAAGNLPIPAALTRGVDLQVIDFNELELTATADGTGTATAQSDYLQQGQYLRIERIVVLGDSNATPEITVYHGDSAVPQRGRDWTQLPAGFVAVAEYPAFLTILPTRCLMVQLTGANPGDVFFISAQYQQVQKILRGGT